MSGALWCRRTRRSWRRSRTGGSPAGRGEPFEKYFLLFRILFIASWDDEKIFAFYNFLRRPLRRQPSCCAGLRSRAQAGRNTNQMVFISNSTSFCFIVHGFKFWFLSLCLLCSRESWLPALFFAFLPPGQVAKVHMGTGELNSGRTRPACPGGRTVYIYRKSLFWRLLPGLLCLPPPLFFCCGSCWPPTWPKVRTGKNNYAPPPALTSRLATFFPWPGRLLAPLSPPCASSAFLSWGASARPARAPPLAVMHSRQLHRPWLRHGLQANAQSSAGSSRNTPTHLQATRYVCLGVSLSLQRHGCGRLSREVAVNWINNLMYCCSLLSSFICMRLHKILLRHRNFAHRRFSTKKLGQREALAPNSFYREKLFKTHAHRNICLFIF